MIDIHSHILPNIDDGAKDLEDAIFMAELAVESGVDCMIATPHANIKGVFENYYNDDFEKAFDRFSKALEERNIPLKLKRGMEIYGVGNITKLIKKGYLITLNSSRYVLIEFPFGERYSVINKTLEELYYEGYVPIVAHPERYDCVQKDIDLVMHWLRSGYNVQLNKGSIIGDFGRRCRSTAYRMLDEGLVSFIASDAHNPYRRTPCLDGVRSILEEYYPLEYIKRIFDVNPLKVINNIEIDL